MEERFVRNKDVTSNDKPRRFRLVFSDWLLIIMITALFFFLSSAVVTRQDEYSMILQFRQIVRVIDEPGLNFKIPFIQVVEKREQKTLFYEISRSDVITSDKRTMIVDSYVLWRITNPTLYYQTLSGLKTQAEARIDTIVYNAIKNTISSMTQEEIILSRDGDITISDLDFEIETIVLDFAADDDFALAGNDIEMAETKSLTKGIAANLVNEVDVSNYGIEIITVEVKALDLPDSNKEAVYNRMISEREMVRTLYISEGESQAQMIRNEADMEVSVMLAGARTEAAKIIAEGESEYMRILSTAYNDAQRSEFYEFVRALEAGKLAYRNNRGNILMLDKDSPLARIFYNFSLNNSLTAE
ncbi:MAG: protease modulator HflC [Lachnospiraceae bacterium]|nr:protease modulator HflC [Lachnospiraceae bacterium]